MHKHHLGLTWLVLGAFLLLLATGCSDGGVSSALAAAPAADPTDTPIPKPTTYPLPTCPWNQKQIVVPRGETDPDSKTTVYIVPDEINPALQRIVTEGIRSQDLFEAVHTIAFSPDQDRFAVMGWLHGREQVVEFMLGEPYENFVGDVGDRTQMDKWGDWLCYSASGKFLLTLTVENGQWFLLYNERDERDNRFERLALEGMPGSIKLLPPSGKKEGISYKLSSNTSELNIEAMLKPVN